MTSQTETLQLTISGLSVGTKAALERLGNQNGRSVEDYLRELIEAELRSQQPCGETSAPNHEQIAGAHVAANNGAAETPDPLRCREYAWIKKHRDEYAGQHVALVDDQLIAHAATLKELYQLVRASGVHRRVYSFSVFENGVPAVE